MEPTDTLLSLDMSTHDCYYRFRRDFKHISTVIYAHVQDLDIIPQDCQTYGPDVIRELRKSVEVWNQQWTTLTVFKRDGKVRCLQDHWEPHFLSPAVISDDIPRLNVLDLQVKQGLKNRVFQVYCGKQRQILKICPFKFELAYMTRELRAYNMLRKRGCPLIPTISAYEELGATKQTFQFILNKEELPTRLEPFVRGQVAYGIDCSSTE
jgi:hypothetical protein